MGSLEDAVLHNANQFHKWHTELEAACASETEEKYKQYAQLLQGHLASCDRLQDQVRGVCVFKQEALLPTWGMACSHMCSPLHWLVFWLDALPVSTHKHEGWQSVCASRTNKQHCCATSSRSCASGLA